jgi:hypothetical protein
MLRGMAFSTLLAQDGHDIIPKEKGKGGEVPFFHIAHLCLTASNLTSNKVFSANFFTWSISLLPSSIPGSFVRGLYFGNGSGSAHALLSDGHQVPMNKGRMPQQLKSPIRIWPNYPLVAVDVDRALFGFVLCPVNKPLLWLK